MIGVVEGPKTSFLDHIVPLCHLLEIPLFCDDEDVKTAAEIYYPGVKFAKNTANSHVLTVEPSKMRFRGQKTICGFHGNSNKNRDAFWIERFADEDVVLVYGSFFLDFLREKAVLDRIKKVIVTGNYRLAFFIEQKAFFSKWRYGDPSKKRLLYAPTWTFSREKRFDETEVKKLLDQAPQEYQVIVKWHPFMHRMYPAQVEELQERYGEKALFLPESPLVYPLLAEVDLYVGDYSSVGYDFLAFNRPLFFLKPQKTAFGRVVETSENLYRVFDEKDTFEAARRQAYQHAFGEPTDLASLKKNLMEAVQ
jgi:hypothetical protein